MTKNLSIQAKSFGKGFIWYDEFEMWFKDRFYNQDIEYGIIPKIRWDAKIKTFFFFDKERGFYRAVDEERMHNIIFYWADNHNFEISNSNLSIEMKRLKAFLIIEHDKWDEGFRVLEPKKDNIDKFFSFEKVKI